jgi:hypothetical protein
MCSSRSAPIPNPSPTRGKGDNKAVNYMIPIPSTVWGRVRERAETHPGEGRNHILLIKKSYF